MMSKLFIPNDLLIELSSCARMTTAMIKSRPIQNRLHFADVIFKFIFMNENCWSLIQISLKFWLTISHHWFNFFAGVLDNIANDENAFEALTRLTEEIDLYKNPSGTRAAPARTCKDLAMAYPDKENGEDGKTV